MLCVVCSHTQHVFTERAGNGVHDGDRAITLRNGKRRSGERTGRAVQRLFVLFTGETTALLDSPKDHRRSVPVGEAIALCFVRWVAGHLPVRGLIP